MGAIGQFANTITRAGDDLLTQGKTIASKLQSSVGQYVASFGAELKNGKMAGINYATAEGINTAIEAYIAAIDDILNSIDTACDPEQGFKGGFVPQITEFVTAVKTTCHNYVTQLREFETILNQAIAAYKEHEGQTSSNLQGASQEVTNSSTEYEKVSHQA